MLRACSHPVGAARAPNSAARLLNVARAGSLVLLPPTLLHCQVCAKHHEYHLLWTPVGRSAVSSRTLPGPHCRVCWRHALPCLAATTRYDHMPGALPSLCQTTPPYAAQACRHQVTEGAHKVTNKIWPWKVPLHLPCLADLIATLLRTTMPVSQQLCPHPHPVVRGSRTHCGHPGLTSTSALGERLAPEPTSV